MMSLLCSSLMRTLRRPSRRCIKIKSPRRRLVQHSKDKEYFMKLDERLENLPSWLKGFKTVEEGRAISTRGPHPKSIFATIVGTQRISWPIVPSQESPAIQRRKRRIPSQRNPSRWQQGLEEGQASKSQRVQLEWWQWRKWSGRDFRAGDSHIWWAHHTLQLRHRCWWGCSPICLMANEVKVVGPSHLSSPIITHYSMWTCSKWQ